MVPGQLRGGGRVGEQPRDYLAPDRIGQRGEGTVEGRSMVNHVVKYRHRRSLGQAVTFGSYLRTRRPGRRAPEIGSRASNT